MVGDVDDRDGELQVLADVVAGGDVKGGVHGQIGRCMGLHRRRRGRWRSRSRSKHWSRTRSAAGRLAVKPVFSVWRWSWSTGDVVGAKVAGRIVGNAASESADDVAALLGNLIRVGQMELAGAGHSGERRSAPRRDQRSIDGDGEVHIRFAQVGVIEEIVDAIFEELPRRAQAFIGNEMPSPCSLSRSKGRGVKGVLADGAGCWRS